MCTDRHNWHMYTNMYTCMCVHACIQYTVYVRTHGSKQCVVYLWHTSVCAAYKHVCECICKLALCDNVYQSLCTIIYYYTVYVYNLQTFTHHHIHTRKHNNKRNAHRTTNVSHIGWWICSQAKVEHTQKHKKAHSDFNLYLHFVSLMKNTVLQGF